MRSELIFNIPKAQSTHKKKANKFVSALYRNMSLQDPIPT